MGKIRSSIFRFNQDDAGNIALMAALTAPMIVGVLALGVDYGALTLQKRQLQQSADLAAISAASALDAEQAVLQYFKLNGQKIGIRTGSGLLTEGGLLPKDADIEGAGLDGYAEITTGRYVADPDTPVERRFTPNAAPADAVKVAIFEKGRLYFASGFTTPPDLSAVGTAGAQKVAAFSVGSRAASLNDGLINSVLSTLFGSTIHLKVGDYQSLASADVSLLKTIDILATDLKLNVGTYRELVTTKITLSQFLSALARTSGLQPSVASTIQKLERAANTTTLNFPLEKIVNLGPFLDNMVGSSGNPKVTVSVFDLISATAIAANGRHQFEVDAGTNIPGLASTKLTIAIGELPVLTTSLAVGGVGTVVRTAQTRVALNTTVDGLKALAGLQVRLPLYVEMAPAEGKLVDIRCAAGGNNAVDVDVVPGVVEIAVGKVDTSAFSKFGSKSRVTKAAIVDSRLVKINGMSHVTVGNLAKTRLTFTQADINQATIKDVSTRDGWTSYIQSILKNFDLDINVLALSVGSPTAVQAALADTLSVAARPVDQVLYNVMLIFGVKVGEADVRVTDARCMQPALLQ
ncbi:TadG family pilus assembly protein [Agrobacterium larrymoorei]|uniref:Membrane protein n=1 Tax=Agrobacterium larrymoorei TaxID=160699 RepID=A0ABU0UGM5_9HYPH|nr:TadG family pilus assembly protein [Agrobacterium larrymoorei]MDQ1184092.1 putative membrane protein [Agrobacterium larrymoorei]